MTHTNRTPLGLDSFQPDIKPGFGLDHVVEHVEVNTAARFDDLPTHFGVGDPEVLLLNGLDLTELQGVGVARVEDDLDEIDGFAALDPKLETVAEINEGVSAEHDQTAVSRAAGRWFRLSCLPPCEELGRGGLSLLRGGVGIDLCAGEVLVTEQVL